MGTNAIIFSIAATDLCLAFTLDVPVSHAGMMIVYGCGVCVVMCVGMCISWCVRVCMCACMCVID